MNYQFSNLLGAPYRGGTLLLRDDELLSPVGNRVSQVNLTHSTSQTLPFENLKQIRTLCLSPDGVLLMSIDEDGRAVLINKQRRVLLHHFSFKAAVAAAKFSPDGRYLAVAVGRLLQVWRTPGLQKLMSPMQLHREYGQCHSDVTDLDWSPDSRFIAVASKDITARIFSLEPLPGFQPSTLSGHKDSLMGVFFTSSTLAQAGGSEAPLLFTLSREGALLAWSCSPKDVPAPSTAGTASVVPAVAEEPCSSTAESEEESAEVEGAAAGQPRAAVGTLSEQQGSPSAPSFSQKRQKGVLGQAVPSSRILRRLPRIKASRAGRRRSQHHSLALPAADIPPAALTGPLFPELSGKRWWLSGRHFLNLRGAQVSSYAWHAELGVLVVGLSNGVFEIYQMPEFRSIHTLSIGRERVTSLAFNAAGDWVAVGCAKLGQVLVWEWRSETYVLKQQGHYAEIAATAFSPDGALVVTGSDDHKVKVFNVSSGFCFVTFTDHSAPVTAVVFLPTGHAVLSASLDGTVRAYDLVRYRNFRTLAAPSAVQFGSLAVDPGGEIVCAGTLDTFHIYVWSLKTGRLLDVLAGHEGPVAGLAFSPTTGELASCSWDHTVRLWDVFNGKGTVEALQHSHDVLALAFRPDGKELASATLDGQIYFWSPREGELLGTIEGRRDIRGGRLASDRRAAGNLASGACFTSLVYSADGSVLLGGGVSKYVVLYDVAERLMLRRFQLSHNRGLDGVLDQLSSKHITDAGPLALIDHDHDDPDVELLPPVVDLAGAADVPGSASTKRALLRSRGVCLSPTGRSWAAATPEGLMLYSLDEEIMFDPTSLTEGVTTKECQRLLAQGQFSQALIVALRLNDKVLLHHVVMSTPPAMVTGITRSMAYANVPPLLAVLAAALANEPHLEFLLNWVQGLARQHGRRLAAAALPSSKLMPIIRELQKALNLAHTQLAGICETNLYTLDYMCTRGLAPTAPVAAAGAGADAIGDERFTLYEKPPGSYEVWLRKRRKDGQERQGQLQQAVRAKGGGAESGKKGKALKA